MFTCLAPLGHKAPFPGPDNPTDVAIVHGVTAPSNTVSNTSVDSRIQQAAAANIAPFFARPTPQLDVGSQLCIKYHYRGECDALCPHANTQVHLAGPAKQRFDAWAKTVANKTVADKTL